MTQTEMFIAPTSQAEEILLFIQRHGSITRAQAASLYIFELSARICELQKRGWSFDRDEVEGENRYGRKYRVTKYSNARYRSQAE